MIDAPDGTVEVENPAEVLRDEDGVFEVTSHLRTVVSVYPPAEGQGLRTKAWDWSWPATGEAATRSCIFFCEPLAAAPWSRA
jgi:hypothetical protein